MKKLFFTDPNRSTQTPIDLHDTSKWEIWEQSRLAGWVTIGEDRHGTKKEDILLNKLNEIIDHINQEAK